MESADDISPSGASRRGSSVTCNPLLGVATPEMFRANAFRITGLAVDASMREITKHADKLKMMEELGQGKSLHAGAFALKTPPTVDQIREAVQRLKDPEQRIIDEFFWFWPRQFGQSTSDPALSALRGGDADTALEIWMALETSPFDGHVAMHNVAVLWHLMALEWENHYAKTEFTAEKTKEIERLWRGAFKRWYLLAVDDLFWESVTTRIKQIDDPRLTSGFARRMRVTLPLALNKINAELALRYAESGRMDMARFHVQFMRDNNQGPSNFGKAAELVLSPTTTRLKQQIDRAQQRANKNPADAVSAARELLNHAPSSLILFELFFGKESEARNELSDEVAALCNQLQVEYHKATGDNQGCLDLLRAALAFATSAEQRQRIEKNIGTLNGNLKSKQLEPVYAILKALQESSALPSVRFSRFKSDAVPAITKATVGIVGSEEHTDLVNAAAIILRAISLSAWNEHQDMTTAVAANEMAIKYGSGTEMRKRLTEDQTTLREMMEQAPRASHQATKQNSSSNSSDGCLVLLGIIGLFALINSCNSAKSSLSSSSSNPSLSTPKFNFTLDSRSPSLSNPESTYLKARTALLERNAPSPSLSTPESTYQTPKSTSVASPTYTPPVSDNAKDKDTYRVPKTRTTELDRDRQAVNAAKARAQQYSNQIETLASEIERDRAYLDRNSQSAVDNFNQKVNRYNAAIEQGRAQEQTVNQLVESYNMKLSIYGH